VVPRVETLYAALAVETGATVGVKTVAVGFKTPAGLKL